MNPLTAWLRRRPRPGRGGAAAPAPLPLPDLDGDTSATHMRHAHRLVTAARIGHGRWLTGHHCVDLDVLVGDANEAIEHLRTFVARLGEERRLLADIPNDPEEGR